MKSSFLTLFDPAPGAGELPVRLASPFDPAEPPALARRAAGELQARLAVHSGALEQPGGGKMFGVLVVATQGGRVGWLAGFSGMLGGRWEVDGFVPPLFDRSARDAFWPAGEAELGVLDARRRELMEGGEAVALRASLAEVAARHGAALAVLRARHRENRAARKAARARLDAAGTGDEERTRALHELAQASRADTAEERRQEQAHRVEREAVAGPLAALEARAAELEAERVARSRVLLLAIYETYRVVNARGERRALVDLFAPEAPPGGAGDCAAPKLFAHAFAHRLRPLALAEFWWGAPPATGDRRAGSFYPACRRKCGPLLPFLLSGRDVDPAPIFGRAGPDLFPDEPRVLFEDEWLLVVDKPVGLLSVPGRHAQLRDSVLVRLRRRFPAATGPIVVHRLDLDTSGLLLCAKDEETHAALQKQFARREVDKRYVAWLDGELPGARGESGVIELPLRVDLDDRPRQIVDSVHGKRAVTEWRVIERTGGKTRVALFPRTGRTHQLRVHASHPGGLGIPIVGDRIYGRGAERLMLHAESLAFVHPRTGARVELTSPAPF